MDSGIATVMTMPTKPNTRPCISGSTRSWMIVNAGVLRVANVMPISSPSTKNTHMFVDTPSPATSTPVSSTEPTMSRTRRLIRGPKLAMSSPPSSMPPPQNSSLAVSFHTSSPKVRVTISGVR